MDTPTVALAKRVEATRTSQNITILGLAEATGIPRTSLKRRLDGKDDFTISQLIACSKHLNVSAVVWLDGIAA